MESNTRGERQAAFQILAASSPGALAKVRGDLWDSGKVASGENLGIAFAGKTLASAERVWWKVRVWDGAGEASAFSEPAWFETGLLSPADWQARWIQRKSAGPTPEARAFDDHPAPLLRKEFVLSKKIASARAYASGLGCCELYLNGHRVGDQVLDPGWTSYGKRVLYSVYDVTGLVKNGRNAAGIMLGNGWFNPLPLAFWGHLQIGQSLTTGEPRAIVQLVVRFTDGTAQTISTDESWRAGDGPILRNNVYLGEFYDARREQPGWDTAGFDDSHWEPAALARGPELGPLHAQDAPPIRATRTLKAVKLTEPKPGVFIFDFGRNFAGWARLRVRGPAGARVRLRSGELLYPDGSLNGMTSVAGQIKGGGPHYEYGGEGPPKTAFQLDQYILKGQGTETFTPRFTFHGFRYVEVTGYPGRPELDALEGLALNADVASAGSFECSDDLFNRIQDMVRWTELANLFSVQSDCPHREKFGYGGDLVASSEMAMLNFDMDRFYAKVTQDFADAARPNGGFTETAPFAGIADQGLGGKEPPVDLGGGAGPVDWGLAQPLLVWQLRQYYGDQRPLQEQYESSKRWIQLLESKAADNLLDNGISDHEGLAPKPRALTGTAAYYLNVKLFAQIARASGHDSDADAAALQAERIKAAFNRKFLEPGTGRYDIASQACEAAALYMGLAPAEEEPRALDILVKDIMETHQGHLTTGIFGAKYMLNALGEFGRPDVAWQIVHQRTFPGWGYMLDNGATTLWEHWAFSDNTYSHDHPMFGSVSEWFYKTLAGIEPAPEAVGFDRLIIRPQPVGDLRWVKASYDSVRGRIVSEWSREGGQFKLTVRIPVGCAATVYLPARDAEGIEEGGEKIGRAPGVRLLRMEKGRAVLSAASGEYHFTSHLP
ncbi:MAG TPA: family 78 glycoside hydrolase catalytic domain [Verrucomicrobiae bacterium]